MFIHPSSLLTGWQYINRKFFVVYLYDILYLPPPGNIVVYKRHHNNSTNTNKYINMDIIIWNHFQKKYIKCTCKKVTISLMVEDLYSILISDRGLIKYRSRVFGQKIILKKDIETCNRTYIIRYVYIYIYVRELTNRICTCVKCQRLTNRDRCGCLLVLDIEPRTFLKILNHVLRKH